MLLLDPATSGTGDFPAMLLNDECLARQAKEEKNVEFCVWGDEIGFEVDKLSEGLREKKRFPLMTIIVSWLPNLTSLSLDMIEDGCCQEELDNVLANERYLPS